MAAALPLAVVLPAGAQLDGPSLFREGNALVRSGVYRTALLRYREAAAAGFDEPLLHYNLGIVHYKLGQYEAAEPELERAAQDPALAGLASYNLGLTHLAQGDQPEARRWFALAAERTDHRRLRALAERAGEKLSAPPEPGRPAPRVATRAGAAERVGELDLRVDAGYGTDDNVYRGPPGPYVDLSQAGQPLVTPELIAAAYVPVDVSAAYLLHNEAGDTTFVFGYTLDADYYEAEFANADRVTQRLDIGADILLGENGKRRRTVESAFFYRDHYETSFDPDDGYDREVDGIDVAGRTSYQAAGVEGDFQHRLGAWAWGFDMRFERRQYERIELLASYDHEYYATRVSVDYDFSDAMTLSLGLHRYRRLYDARRARDLDGDLLLTNEPLRYDYRGAAVGITRRVGRAVELGFDYLRLDRIDEFLGYYDYTQDVARLRATFRPSSRFYLSLGAVSRTYEYPNAFAFNEPTAGPRELEELRGELTAEFQISNSWSIWAELGSEDVTSTDLRAEYARSRTMLGAKWRR
jgi:tetratricopeptide (TPR) repeat protein